jgi:hypothetical protein
MDGRHLRGQRRILLLRMALFITERLRVSNLQTGQWPAGAPAAQFSSPETMPGADYSIRAFGR